MKKTDGWGLWHVNQKGDVYQLMGNYQTGPFTFKSKRSANKLAKKVKAKNLKMAYFRIPLNLCELMNEAHRLELHATGHALHEAVKKLGWELAEKKIKSVKVESMLKDLRKRRKSK